MQYTISTLIILAIASTVQSNTNIPKCESIPQDKVYFGYVAKAEEFNEKTCGTLDDETMQAKCACYYQRALLESFAHCPGSEGEAQQLFRSASASCADVGYATFPTLETPAPWQTDFSGEVSASTIPIIPAVGNQTKKTKEKTIEAGSTEESTTESTSGVSKGFAIGSLLVAACGLLV